MIRPTAQQLLDCVSSASPKWVPPPMYPAVVINSRSIVDSYSDLFDSLGTSAPTSRAGAVNPIGSLLVLIVGLLVLIMALLLFIIVST